MAIPIDDELRLEASLTGSVALAKVDHIQGAFRVFTTAQDLQNHPIEQSVNDQIVWLESSQSLYQATITPPNPPTSFFPTLSWSVFTFPGGGGSADTGSLMTTASAALNVLTFTKGDGTTFPVTIDTGSGGGSVPAGTVSSSAQITNLGFINQTQTSSMSVASASIATIATYTSEWALGANGSSDYTFTGPGLIGAENDPTIYLTRGQQYKFTNNMGAHPFRIQSTPNGSTGTPYNDGITNNDVSNGTLLWNVQFDSPDTLYYQCTAHTGMGGKIVIIDSGSGASIPAGTVSSSAQITNLGFVQSDITASLLNTASVNLNEITFTKGDGSTFAITVDTGSGSGGGSGSADLTQELTANLTVGGVTSGESFASGSSIEALLRDMLITYQEPTVGSLTIRNGGSGVSTSTRDVGASFTCDDATFTAGVDSPNGDYPQSASLSCTGADIGSFSEDGPNDVQASNTITFSTTRTIQKTSAGSVSFTVSTDSRNSGDTQSTGRSFSWQWRNYLAASSTIISSDSTLQSVINNDLVANAFDTNKSWNPTCGAANNTAGNYTYVIYPASYGDLNNIIQDGATPVLTAFTKLGDFSADNSEGISQNWRVYKSNADQAFASGTALAIS